MVCIPHTQLAVPLSVALDRWYIIISFDTFLLHPLLPIPYFSSYTSHPSSSICVNHQHKRAICDMTETIDPDGTRRSALAVCLDRLKKIEADAEQQISSWDPKYLSQDPDVTTAAAVAGTKRKGMCQTGLCVNELTLPVAAMEDEPDSDLDDDDSDDGDDRVPAYDPDQQNRPKLPLYHPGFELTESTATNILETIIQFITDSIEAGLEDEEATHLRAELQRKSKVPAQEIVRICLSGTSGAGKSALLNALLAVVNLNVEVSWFVRTWFYRADIPC